MVSDTLLPHGQHQRGHNRRHHLIRIRDFMCARSRVVACQTPGPMAGPGPPVLPRDSSA